MRPGSALSMGRSIVTSNVPSWAWISVFTTRNRIEPSGAGSTRRASARSERFACPSAACITRAKRVSFSECTSSMLQPQMLSCG